MSVKKDLAGRRSVQVETEVPGTPEEVWKAIASAEGISSWFVPARIETDANGQPKQLVLHFGPGMDSVKDDHRLGSAAPLCGRGRVRARRTEDGN